MSMRDPKYGLVAALLTRMSSDPKRSTVAAAQASAASGSPALAASQATSPSKPASDDAAVSSASTFARHEHDVRPGFGEAAGDGPADAAGAPGDEGHLAVES